MRDIYRAIVNGLLRAIRGSARQEQVSQLIDGLMDDIEAAKALVEARGLTIGEVLQREAEAMDEYLTGPSSKNDTSESLRKAVIWRGVADSIMRGE